MWSPTHPSPPPLDGDAAPVAAMRQIDLEPRRAALAGLPPGLWTLARIGPRHAGEAQVRYTHASGREVVGQWIDEEAAFSQVVQATRRVAVSPAQVVTLPPHRLLWQLGGADRRLPKLAALCQAGASLVVHHPEQRAVVRLPSAAHYVKVVQPARAPTLAARLHSVHHALAARGARTPQVVALDAKAGLVAMSALPGRSLLSWLANRPSTPAHLAALGQMAGHALAALHASPLPHGPRHDAAAAAAGLDRWLVRLSWVAPGLHSWLAPRAPRVQAVLLDGDATALVPLHRDCYDKQFIGDENGIGLLDFDTLAWGEAAWDVANFLIHCDLRVWQGRCPPNNAAALAGGFLHGYGALPAAARLHAYADAVRLRLACVYGCRPPQRGVVLRLVESIGAPLLGLP